tara:strand:- start:479 stop:814 length:336 start_codon:yes stop_codon:yes gene_type:complete
MFSKSLSSYQKSAKSFALYPEDMKILYPSLGLCGECGEVAEKIKKVIRDKNGIFSAEQKQEIKKELGDVLWYMANLSSDLGLNLSDIAAANLRKLKERKKRGTISGSGDNR